MWPSDFDTMATSDWPRNAGRQMQDGAPGFGEQEDLRCVVAIRSPARQKEVPERTTAFIPPI